MKGDSPIDTGGLTTSVTVIGLVLLLLVSLVGGVMAFEGVNEGNVKVVKNQGAVTGKILEPGWHFITPIVEGTVSISTRPQTYTMSHQSDEGDNANQDDSVASLPKMGSTPTST